MRIAITVDPELPVPPRLYGGIERVVDLLVRGLVDRGHSVTLFANPKSRAPCTLVPLRGRRSRSLRDTLRNTVIISTEAVNGHFEVVHSFGRLAYLWPLLAAGKKVIMTYQRPITRRSVGLGVALSRNTIRYTAVGRHLIDGLPGRWHVIPNGVDTELFTPSTTVSEESPLVFLGRIEYVKGVHVAIEVARAVRKRLVIMGNIEPEHRGYFDAEVRPHIDGRTIEFMGEVDDATKIRALKNAAALLMPVLWDEPFGLVMVESLACGTPVIGFDRGAVADVVEDGVTGFVCQDAAQMSASVARIGRLSRKQCRMSAERRFSQSAVVSRYERVYREMGYG